MTSVAGEVRRLSETLRMSAPPIRQKAPPRASSRGALASSSVPARRGAPAPGSLWSTWGQASATWREPRQSWPRAGASAPAPCAAAAAACMCQAVEWPGPPCWRAGERSRGCGSTSCRLPSRLLSSSKMYWVSSRGSRQDDTPVTEFAKYGRPEESLKGPHQHSTSHLCWCQRSRLCSSKKCSAGCCRYRRPVSRTRCRAGARGFSQVLDWLSRST
mmetsp:Transcript_27436/g.57035  ORF Transcript_27436/g.57035 Transcript_27436/m.57035 type:complete len:216 (+) Transcript_27436:502-1149(+)